jgi:hypothetical protein
MLQRPDLLRRGGVARKRLVEPERWLYVGRQVVAPEEVPHVRKTGVGWDGDGDAREAEQGALRVGDDSSPSDTVDGEGRDAHLASRRPHRRDRGVDVVDPHIAEPLRDGLIRFLALDLRHSGHDLYVCRLDEEVGLAQAYQPDRGHEAWRRLRREVDDARIDRERRPVFGGAEVRVRAVLDGSKSGD